MLGTGKTICSIVRSNLTICVEKKIYEIKKSSSNPLTKKIFATSIGLRVLDSEYKLL